MPAEIYTTFSRNVFLFHFHKKKKRRVGLLNKICKIIDARVCFLFEFASDSYKYNKRGGADRQRYFHFSQRNLVKSKVGKENLRNPNLLIPSGLQRELNLPD